MISIILCVVVGVVRGTYVREVLVATGTYVTEVLCQNKRTNLLPILVIHNKREIKYKDDAVRYYIY